MNFEELKEEAKRRGIESGATIFTQHHGRITLEEVPDWHGGDYGLFLVDENNPGGAWVFYEGKWAEVITPSPAQDTDVLEPGMACREFTPAQRDYALARAKELDLSSNAPQAMKGWLVYAKTNTLLPGVSISGPDGSYWSTTCMNFKPFSEFMRRMENTKPNPKELDLEKAKELLSEFAGHYGKSDAWFLEMDAKLAEYGIK